ncbi:MAG: N-acetyltransferase [Clostridia bacterium]|nr:N-acetyltransferase [Clostridia bacterium]
MANNIHPSVKMGEYCVIGDNVTIGEGCVIGHHVVIHNDTAIGDNVRIDDFTCIGKRPMKAANSAVTVESDLPACVIGSGCIIGTGAVIYRGCTLGERVLAADLATVRERVTIGERTIIGRGASVECDCTVGRKCKIETNAYITAYSTLGDMCFIAPGVVTSNDNFAGRSEERFKHFKGVTVKNGGRIAAGSVILPGKVIGEQAMAAAGSVVTKDVPEKTVVVGAPAKVLRAVPEDQLLQEGDYAK